MTYPHANVSLMIMINNNLTGSLNTLHTIAQLFYYQLTSYYAPVTTSSEQLFTAAVVNNSRDVHVLRTQVTLITH